MRTRSHSLGDLNASPISKGKSSAAPTLCAIPWRGTPVDAIEERPFAPIDRAPSNDHRSGQSHSTPPLKHPPSPRPRAASDEEAWGQGGAFARHHFRYRGAAFGSPHASRRARGWSSDSYGGERTSVESQSPRSGAASFDNFHADAPGAFDGAFDEDEADTLGLPIEFDERDYAAWSGASPPCPPKSALAAWLHGLGIDSSSVAPPLARLCASRGLPRTPSGVAQLPLGCGLGKVSACFGKVSSGWAARG